MLREDHDWQLRNDAAQGETKIDAIDAPLAECEVEQGDIELPDDSRIERLAWRIAGGDLLHLGFGTQALLQHVAQHRVVLAIEDAQATRLWALRGRCSRRHAHSVHV